MLAMLMLVMAQNLPGPIADEDAARPPLLQRSCRPRGDEVVVCGEAESHRLRPLPGPGSRPGLPAAQARIAPNKRVGLRAAGSGNPTASAPRAIVDLTIGF